MWNEPYSTDDQEWDNKTDTYSRNALWVLGTFSVLYFGTHFVLWLITN